MKNNLVSVIVSTKNEAQNIERLLKSIVGQSYNDIEIIIVDNNSTDNTVMLSKKYTPLIYKSGPERSAQRNFGARKAQGEYLLFLDADMELAPSIISDCIKALQKENLVAVTIPETVRGRGFFVQIKKLEKLLYEGEEMVEAARFFRKTAFFNVDGYNETLVAGEDWDLSTRVRRLGKITRITTSLYHYETSFLRELLHKTYYAYKMRAYAKLYPEKFALQSGGERMWLFWRKKNLLLVHPLETVGLFLVKGLEYGLYRLLRLFT